ncbi:MAG: hypothetical protein R3F31_27340 [Verrucomicrobiales bacterium]
MHTPAPFDFLGGAALVLLLVAAGLVPAQEQSAATSGGAVPPAGAAPKVEKIGDHTYRLGEIIIDARRKPSVCPLRSTCAREF